ncbi:MAG: hypothetical protein GTN46_02355 [Gammaproteobacteria bacterium]|nr:hypothetical protein [Gammaproteobacteria bacterium]NIO61718.1 hypothetical protein [Gammaproteobacteria bacterium]NIQ18969.1 hypothetical protein [Gammaproteobacteria bacterium]NIT05018.1 hypothetical protein [Gammaproteobacteria bacterium]NIT40391.1 hypothetical protein [Gammaproteobacteria bacterium]
MINKQLLVLSSLLMIIGISFLVYKSAYLGFPLTPGQETSVWNVEIKINFQASNRPIKLMLYVPRNSRYFSIINENFISRGYGVSISTTEGNRQVAWSIRKASGQQTLYYQAVVERLDLGDKDASTKKITPISAGYTGADLEAALAVLSEAKEKSADPITLLLQLIDLFNDPGNNYNVDLLLRGKTNPDNIIDSIIRVLSLDGIAARQVHGLKMVESLDHSESASWIEVYTSGEWKAVDMVTKQFVDLSDYLVLWKGRDKMVTLTGGSNLDIDINIRRAEIESLAAASTREKNLSPNLSKYSLSNLPLDTQNVYSILLTVPFGVFLLVILRNIIGIKTFGTFMPILIALSFRETQLLSGLILFTLLVTLGLAIRFYLERLKLLLVPRLASVLIIVIMLMLVMSILSHNLGIESGLSVALFPMVIITMTIERMSIVWEEKGSQDAIYQGIGSLIAAAVAFQFMSNDMVEHLITVFPEIVFIILSLTLLLGRYTGYRLLELQRFKVLVNK